MAGGDGYDPDLWDEEQLHVALSKLHLDESHPEPLRDLRRRLGRLLARPIDEKPLEIGGVPVGLLPERPEDELAAMPPRALLVWLDELAEWAVYSIPLAELPWELVSSLGEAHGGVLGTPHPVSPSRYVSLVRVAAAVTTPAAADELWALHVLDRMDDIGDEAGLPSLETLRSWMGVLLERRVRDVAELDACFVRVCSILST